MSKSLNTVSAYAWSLARSLRYIRWHTLTYADVC